MSKLTPTKKDLLFNKFLSIACFAENAKTKIDKGFLVKGKDYLDTVKKLAEEGMEILRSIVNEKDLWQE